jgi:hypothetical protein
MTSKKKNWWESYKDSDKKDNDFPKSSTKSSFGWDYDLFGRKKSDSYTSYNSSSRLYDWDKEYSRGNYSNFFANNWGKNKNYEKLKMVKSMFSVIGLESSKYKMTSQTALKQKKISASLPIDTIKTELNNSLHNFGFSSESVSAIMANNEVFLSDSSYVKRTDSKTIIIPNHLLDDKSLNDDTFYGASLLNASAYKFLNPFDYRDYVVKKFYNIQQENANEQITSFLHVLLADEYIQQKLGENYPGYQRFIQSYKDSLENIHQKTYNVPLTQERTAFIAALSKLIQYPSSLREDEYTHFEEGLTDAKDVLNSYIDSLPDFSTCLGLAEELTKIVLRYKDPENEKKDQENKSSSSLNNLLKNLLNKTEASPSGIQENLQDISDFNKKQLEKEKLERLMIPDMHELVDDELVYFDKRKKETESEATKEKYRELFLETRCRNMSVLRRLFERLNKDYQYHLKGMRSGRLDTNKLAEAKQHVDTIYERIARVQTNKVCVGVLIDESGSMSGSSIANAQKAAILINEIFRNNPNVELFIYGHTADYHGSSKGTVENITPQTYIRVYKEPGMTQVEKALTTVKARANNKDGTAIFACAKRIRKFTKNNGFLFVISDGQPHARNYGGRPAHDDVVEKVKKCEKMNLDCIQIAIAGYDGGGKDKMFKHIVQFKDISTLGQDLANFMSSKIIGKLKHTISIS